MDTFKNKLRRLINNSKNNFDEIKDIDPDRHFIKLIYEQKRKIRNNFKNTKTKGKNNKTTKNYFRNNLFNDYHTNSTKLKEDKFPFSRNESNNSNKKIYNQIFSYKKISKEQGINNINTLMRSFTIKDIHNSFDSLNLSKSFSHIDINETERKKNSLKKKISYIKKEIGLDYRTKNKINYNDSYLRSLNNNLYKFNNKDYFIISPSYKNKNIRKKMINVSETDYWNTKIIEKENILNKMRKNNFHLRTNSDYSRIKNNFTFIKIHL